MGIETSSWKAGCPELREDQEGGHVLFRIDDYVFRQWQHERKADVVAKVVGDFSAWDTDIAKYDDALARLMRELEPWRDDREDQE